MQASEQAKILLPFLIPALKGAGGGGGGGATSTNTITVDNGLVYLRTDGTRPLEGNLVVNTGVTIDGVDISVHASNPDAHHNRASEGSGIILNYASQVVSVNQNFDFTWTQEHEFTVGLRAANVTATVNLTLNPAGDLYLSPTGNDVLLTSGVRLGTPNYASQLTGWRVDYAGAADFRYIYVDEMHAKSFIADLEQALAGGQIITKSVSILADVFTAPAPGAATFIYVKDLPSAHGMAVFQSGDIIRIRQFSRANGSLSIANCWGAVTNYVQDPNGFQSWTFTRSVAPNAGTMVTGSTVNVDAIVLDYGVSGNGFYEVNAIDGYYAANSPYSQIVTWTGHPATGLQLRARLGNLAGVSDPDVSPSGYGLYSDNVYLKGDFVTANGVIRMYQASGINIQEDVWGNWDNKRALQWWPSTAVMTGAPSMTMYTGKAVGGFTDLQNFGYVEVNPTGGRLASLVLTAYHEGTASDAIISLQGGGTVMGTTSVIDVVVDKVNITSVLHTFGILTPHANIIPDLDLTRNLGTVTKRFNTVYANQMVITGAISGATLSGQEWEYTGNMTIDANSASATTLSIVNQGAGTASLSVESNITVGGLVDGVDVALFKSGYDIHTGDPNAHHNQQHGLNSVEHTVSGLVTNQVLRATSATTFGFQTLLHSEITNLGSDDHTQYTHNTLARTITARHIFNPPVAGSPFILGANALGQLVTGLNADQLDGEDQFVFMRKSANSDLDMNFFDIYELDALTANSGTFSSITNPGLTVGNGATGFLRIGAGTAWHSANDGAGSGLDADLFDSYDSGVFPRLNIANTFTGTNVFNGADTTIAGSTANFNSTVTSFSGATTSINSPTIYLGAASGTTVDLRGNAITSGDVDTNHVFGRASIGYVGHIDHAAFSHRDFVNTTGYALLQRNDGHTFVNAAAAASLHFQINNVDGFLLDSSKALRTGDYASQVTGWRIGSVGDADFRYLYVDQMHAKSFIADLEQALAGGQIITKSVTTLFQDFTAPYPALSTVLKVKDLPSAANMATFESGDMVRLRQFSRAGGGLSIADCWGVVTGYTDQTNGDQDWTFTRSVAASYNVIALRTFNTATTASALTLALTTPAGTLNGELMVVALSYVGTRTITAPTGWGLLVDEPTTGITLRVYTKIASASEPISYTWTFNLATNMAGSISTYTNCYSANALDTATGQLNASGTAMVFSNATSRTQAAMMVAIGAVAGNIRATTPVSMVERADVGAGSAGVYTAEEMLTAVGASGTRTSTLATAAVSATATLLLFPTYASLVGTSGAMTPGSIVKKDAIVLDYGVSGNGYYEVNAIDGIYGANSPYAQTVTWTGHPATGSVVRTREGNLTGLGYTSEYGLYARGADATQYLKASGTGVFLANVNIDMTSGGASFAKFNNALGIELTTLTASNAQRAYTFRDATSGELGGLYAYAYGAPNGKKGFKLDILASAGYDALGEININAGTGEDAHFDIRVGNGTRSTWMYFETGSANSYTYLLSDYIDFSTVRFGVIGSGNKGIYFNTGYYEAVATASRSEISNDILTYKELVLAGNTSAGGFKRIGLYDDVQIGGSAYYQRLNVNGGAYFADDIGIGVTNPDGLEIRVPTTDTAKGVDNVRLGIVGGVPRIMFEDASYTQWGIDNSLGIMRFVSPGVVHMTLGTTGLNVTNKIGDTQLLTLTTGWGNIAGWGSATSKKFGDMVWLTGLVIRNSGTSPTITTLPVDRRPTTPKMFVTFVYNNTTEYAARVDVNANGTVTLAVNPAAVGYVTLSPICFMLGV